MDTLASFNKAEELFKSAQEDMMKPEEDLVPYSVCHKSYHAISNYLQGFLHHHKVDSHEENLKKQIEMAISIDQKFTYLTNPILRYPTETEDIWMNLDVARDFVTMAEKTRNLVGL
jgi:hypothetical protein